MQEGVEFLVPVCMHRELIILRQKVRKGIRKLFFQTLPLLAIIFIRGITNVTQLLLIMSY